MGATDGDCMLGTAVDTADGAAVGGIATTTSDKTRLAATVNTGMRIVVASVAFVTLLLIVLFVVVVVTVALA